MDALPLDGQRGGMPQTAHPAHWHPQVCLWTLEPRFTRGDAPRFACTVRAAEWLLSIALSRDNR